MATSHLHEINIVNGSQTDTYLIEPLLYSTATLETGTNNSNYYTASIADFELINGVQISIKIPNDTSGTALKIGSREAIPIYYNGSNIEAGLLQQNRIYSFIYTNNVWEIVGDLDTDTVYTLPHAEANVLGGIKVGYTTNNQNYKVQLDSNNNAYVSIPWTDTTYEVFNKSGTNHTIGLVPDPGETEGNTKFLREDGTWAVPSYISNTDEKLKIAAVTSGTTYYPIVAANSTSAKTRQYDATGFAYLGTNGTTSTIGIAKITLGNSTASGTTNNKQGSIGLYGSTAYLTTIISGAPTTANILTLPTATGTIALTADIQTIKQDGLTGATINRYGTCSTAADTAAKTVNVTNGTVPTLDSNAAGLKITVKFTNANTAGTPTLNVNSKGAKNIYHRGAQITTDENKALLDGVCDFIFDGTQWHLVGNYYDTTYSNQTAASGGTAVSLVTTGDKYIWNQKQDALVFDETYNSSSNKVATVSTVTNAINALDGGTIGTGSTTKTITALSQTDGKVSATFDNITFPVTSVGGKTGDITLSDLGAAADNHTHDFVGKQGYIAYPTDGILSLDNTKKGYIRIKIPQSVSQTMLSFDVNIFNYVENTSTRYHIAGYNYNDNTWYQPTAYCIAPISNAKANLTVRFTVDSNNNKYVCIGETNTSWSYPKIVISNITINHSGTALDNWSSGWVIELISTAFDETEVKKTITDTNIAYRTVAANITSTANGIAYYEDTSGTFNSTGAGTSGQILTSNGNTTPTWTSVNPSISITDGDGSNAPKINLTVLGASGTTAEELNKASTSAYGVTKLYDGVDSTSTTLAATANAVKTAYDKADGLLAAAKAMIFKGTIGTNGTVTSLPDNHEAGWTYRVITPNTYNIVDSNGKYCETGTLIICITTRTTANATDWTAVETNEDGAVISSATSTTNNTIVRWDNTSGRIIKDSGVVIDDSGSISSTLTTTTSVRYKVTNTNGSVSLLAGTNRGLRDETSPASWIIYKTTNGAHTYIPQWANTGDTTTPVYFNSSGEPTTCSIYAGGTAITLNGTSAAASTAEFYAPTSSGDTGHFLISQGASTAPIWSSNAYISDELLYLYREGTTLENKPTGIRFVNKNTDDGKYLQNQAFIYAYNTHNTNNSGMNMVIQSGGNVYVGGGEAASAVYTNTKPTDGENLYLVADTAIYLEGGVSNGYTERLGIAINASGTIKPTKAGSAYTNQLDLGASDDVWANVYATTFNGKMSTDLVIKLKSGTTEGTDLYTYNGGTAKTLDIKQGSNITLTAAAGSLTIAGTANNAVTQTAIDTNGEYSILLKNNSDKTDETAGTNYVKTKNVTVNPSTATISAIQYYATGSTGAGSSTPGIIVETAAQAWAYIQLDNGSNYWDIATKSNSLSGALEFRPSGASSTGPYITTDGMVSSKFFNIRDGATSKVTLEWNSTDQSLDFIFA